MLFRSGSFDRVVSNYVLMDLPDHEGALAAMHRVLRPGGIAVVVITHPCFILAGAPHFEADGVHMIWHRGYFEEGQLSERWGPFKSAFTGFHRTLTQWWGAIDGAGFTIQGLEEPCPSPEALAQLPPERRRRWTHAPCALALKLTK